LQSSPEASCRCISPASPWSHIVADAGRPGFTVRFRDQLVRWVLLLACLLLVASAVSAAPASRTKTAIQNTAVPDAVEKVSLTLNKLGANRPIELRGTDGTAEVSFSVRLDQLVTRARLNLTYTVSPALLPDLSHLKVYLNDEVVSIIPVKKENAAAQQKIAIDLDPRYLTDFNKLKFQLIGHYTNECESPFHSSLWATISNTSTLDLDFRPVMLKNDLAIFPAPFFDYRDNGMLKLPFAFGASPSLDTLRAAGVLASWFGGLANYRNAQFPSYLDSLPSGYAVVMLTNSERPAYLASLPKVALPTISVISHPTNPNAKLLLILGRDATDLTKAVDAITFGNAALSGTTMTVKDLKYPQRRAAYDVPRWIPVGRPVKFGELVSDPLQLQSRGVLFQGISVNARMPADLFAWESKGVAVDLKYRYTPSGDTNNARLNVEINDEFVDSFNLETGQRSDTKSKFSLPLLDDGLAGGRTDFSIPAFRIGSNNRLYFSFDIPPLDNGKCRATPASDNRAAIDPDSTIDLSRFDHYAALPNLAFFANSGFPFTKYADLAETTVVIPDAPNVAEISTMLGAMGMMGASTGAPATFVKMRYASELDKAGNTDILIIADHGAESVLQRWAKSLPAMLSAAERSFSPLTRTVDTAYEWFGLNKRQENLNGAEATLKGDGPLGAIIGFQSPLAKGRSVVALTGTDATQLSAVLDALQDGGKVRLVRGDLALVRGDTVESFRTDNDIYYVGHLSWWRWIWYRFTGHPMLVALLGIFAGIIVALMAYKALRALAARRLK
jgi:hypothetical protein